MTRRRQQHRMRIARKFWLISSILRRSSRLAHSSIANRNSSSSLSSRKISIFLHGRYHICSGSENLNVFAWKISYMLRIHMEVIEHKLGIDPSFKPIKQKERRYTPDRREAIRQKANSLLEVGFIRPVDYPSSLANPVLLKKPDGSWRMCIDYTSLNKACPKYDSFDMVKSFWSAKIMQCKDLMCSKHHLISMDNIVFLD
jgi:hypothetical protein